MNITQLIKFSNRISFFVKFNEAFIFNLLEFFRLKAINYWGHCNLKWLIFFWLSITENDNVFSSSFEVNYFLFIIWISYSIRKFISNIHDWVLKNKALNFRLIKFFATSALAILKALPSSKVDQLKSPVCNLLAIRTSFFTILNNCIDAWLNFDKANIIIFIFTFVFFYLERFSSLRYKSNWKRGQCYGNLIIFCPSWVSSPNIEIFLLWVLHLSDIDHIFLRCGLKFDRNRLWESFNIMG